MARALAELEIGGVKTTIGAAPGAGSPTRVGASVPRFHTKFLEQWLESDPPGLG